MKKLLSLFNLIALASAVFLSSPVSVRADSAYSGSFGNKVLGGDVTVSHIDGFSNRGNDYVSVLTGNATATLLGFKLKAASGDLRLQLTRPGNRCHATSSLTIASKKIWAFDRTFSNSTSWTSPILFEIHKGGTAPFAVGPVRLDLTASVDVEVKAKAELVCHWSNQHDPIIFASATPTADLAAEGSVDLDLIIVAAGVDANLTLTGYGISSSISMMPRSATGKTTLQLQVAAVTERTEGALSIWAKIRLLIFTKTFRTDVVKFEVGPTIKPFVEIRKEDF